VEKIGIELEKPQSTAQSDTFAPSTPEQMGNTQFLTCGRYAFFSAVNIPRFLKIAVILRLMVKSFITARMGECIKHLGN